MKSLTDTRVGNRSRTTLARLDIDNMREQMRHGMMTMLSPIVERYQHMQILGCSSCVLGYISPGENLSSHKFYSQGR